MSGGECFCPGHAASPPGARVGGMWDWGGDWGSRVPLGLGGCTRGQGLGSSPLPYSVAQWRLKRRSLVSRRGERTQVRGRGGCPSAAVCLLGTAEHAGGSHPALGPSPC